MNGKMINVVTVPTPNPATMMFRPGCTVMETGTANFPSQETAGASPLAARLFGIDGVAGVFLGSDFVSVAKRRPADWSALERPVRDEIEAHFAAGDPVIAEQTAAGPGDAGDDMGDDLATDPADADTVARIRELLDERIRPSVALDGGDIVFRGYRDGVVYLSLQGACIGCPSSSATLKMGAENLLKFYLPEIDRVEAVGPGS